MDSTATLVRRSGRKAKGYGHLRRAEILAAAERIFMAHGYEGATIRKIADEVGVSSTALYMHFPDKARILYEICEGTVQQLFEQNTAIAAKPLDPAVRVRMMLDAYMRWGLAHPNAYQLVYSIPRIGSDTFWPEGANLSTTCYDIFSGEVVRLQAAGRLRQGDAHSVAQVLWMSCHGLVAMINGRPTYKWSSSEDLMKVALDGLMDGLVADPRGPASPSA